MDLVNVIQSQAIRFMQQPMPLGHAVFFPDIVKAVRARYGFVEGPNTVLDHTIERPEGVTFLMGHSEEVAVDRLSIYREGALVEGRESTERMDAFFDDVVDFIRVEFGIALADSAPVSRLYLSKIEVRGQVGLVGAFERLNVLALALAAQVRSYGVDLQPYSVGGFSLFSEAVSGTVPPSRFVFERRVGHPHDANMFVSEAPVSTRQHMELLNTLEKSL
jgi:hypothetical protein